MDATIRRRIQGHYGRPEVVASYGRKTALQPAEQALLSRLEGAIRGKDVLDLGVGTGRTAEHLAPLARRYVGVDYSQEMLAECRRRHPDLDLWHCDARDLGAFAGGSFDFVLFSFNGIDDVDPQGRLNILAEVHRVLRPGGVFAFSTHNLEAKRRSAFALRGRPLSRPLRHYAAGILNHLRMKRHERHGDGYALLNDQSHNFRLLTYYVTPERQAAQLLEAGFTGIETFGDRADAWLYYATRKPS
jgi:ubiquinone/menaquinone biosynthesis C-methylase UbiE